MTLKYSARRKDGADSARRMTIFSHADFVTFSLTSKLEEGENIFLPR
jgi:hypothetical protein